MVGMASAKPARLLRFEKTTQGLNDGLARRAGQLRLAVDRYAMGTETEFRVALEGIGDAVAYAAARLGEIGARVGDTAEAFSRADGRQASDYVDWMDDPTFKASETWFDCGPGGPGEPGEYPKPTPWPKDSTSAEVDRILDAADKTLSARSAYEHFLKGLGQEAPKALGRTVTVVGIGISALQAYRTDQSHNGTERVMRAVVKGGATTGVQAVGTWGGAELGASTCIASGVAAEATPLCGLVGGFLGAVGAGWIFNAVDPERPGARDPKQLAKQIEDPMRDKDRSYPAVAGFVAATRVTDAVS